MDAEESSDESDSELDEKGTDVYCKTMYCKTFFYKPALNLHKKNIRTQILNKRGFQDANSISLKKKILHFFKYNIAHI